MAGHDNDAHQRLMLLEPMLKASALRLTPDEAVADDLVSRTLVVALAESHRPTADVELRVWLSGLLRRSFHSIERGRGARPMRGIRTAVAALDKPQAA